MKTFRQIIGHNNIVNLLKKAIETRKVAHAYLFLGLPGVGKKTVALAFTSSLLCEQPEQGDACAICRTCQQVKMGNHPDVIHVKPAGANIKIDQVRELQKRVMLTPYQGLRQVCLIESIDHLSIEAANCFLKTLEEPPPGVVFILISEQPYALLPTVVSRCQQVFFHPLSHAQVVEGLLLIKGMSREEAELPAALSGGSLGRALELVSGGNLMQRRKRAVEIASALVRATPGQACQMAQALSGEREEIQAWMDVLLFWYRDLLLWRELSNEKLIFNRDFLQEIKQQSKTYNTTRLIDIIYEIEQAKKYLRANSSIGLTCEVLFMHLALKRRL